MVREKNGTTRMTIGVMPELNILTGMTTITATSPDMSIAIMGVWKSRCPRTVNPRLKHQ